MTGRLDDGPTQFFRVTASGKTIYVGVPERADFDRIDMPCSDHGETGDGQLLSKSIAEHGVLVLFQYWVKP